MSRGTAERKSIKKLPFKYARAIRLLSVISSLFSSIIAVLNIIRMSTINTISDIQLYVFQLKECTISGSNDSWIGSVIAFKVAKRISGKSQASRKERRQMQRRRL